INLDVVPRAEHAARVLRDGDVIEIVQFIGGG
ncbi:MAG: sulfur carrier protein ThiS, partial [Candidatus Binatia bacterium]